MSSLSQVQVETVVGISKHENADSLELLHLSNGFTVVDTIGKFAINERIAWVPVDMKTPNIEEHPYLDKGRVRGKKIRGVISCGLPLKLRNPDSKEGENLSAEYGFEPYEFKPDGEEDPKNGQEVKAPIQVSKYDIDSMRKYWRVFQPEVVVTEKIHGENFSFLYDSKSDTFYLKTRTRWLAHDHESKWSKAADKFGMEEKCRALPDLMICGELYGNVQDLKYGSTKGELFFACFDVYKPAWNKFLNYDDTVAICSSQEIPRVPEIYRGPFVSYEHIAELAERKTMVGKDLNQIAEGVVVKPTTELWNPGIGRVILKYPSNQFLMRKQK